MSPLRDADAASTCLSTNRRTNGSLAALCTRGDRVADHMRCSHWHTHTVVAALRPTALSATAIFDGPIDSVTFRAYIEQMLVPTLRRRCRRARQSRGAQTTGSPR